MRFKRTASNCSECPLRDRTRVWGTGPTDPKIILIGEAPGRDEDRLGEPFVGVAGHFLNWGLSKANILRHRCHITNCISCRPPNNNFDSPEALEARECCKPGFEEEIEFLKKRKSVVVIGALGGAATSFLQIGDGITKARGSVYLHNELPVIPTFHPSYLNRMNTSQGEKGTPSYKYVWIADLKKIKNISEHGWEPPQENFNLNPTLNEVEDYIMQRIRNNDLIAVDIETTSLNPKLGNIVVIGLAHNETDALSVPLLEQHGIEYWSAGEKATVRGLLQHLFKSCSLMFQNALFDVRHLQEAGYEIPLENIKHDTLLLHHCLSGDTEIDTLDFGKIPISNLEGKKDFWVVSHDGENLVPKKVKYCWKNKNKSKLIRITFWSKDRINKSKMWIDCTEDHEFPIQGKEGKIKARDLKPGDRLYRGQTCKHMIGGELIHHWTYRHIYGEDIKHPYQVHHLDGNHWNNNPNNLKKVTINDHIKFHKETSYKATIALQRNARKRLERELNSDEVYHMYFKVGLSLRETAEHLNTTQEKIKAMFKIKGWVARSRSEATKLRWKKNKNCRVISITPMEGEYETYDLEVPKTHNFSANGVIVGNSISPELPHNLGFIVSLYGSTPYWKADFLNRDGSIMELDPEMLRTYNCRDVVVLHQILPSLLQDLMETNTEAIYSTESRPLISPIISMMNNGIKLDRSKLRAYSQKLKKEQAALEKDLKAMASLPPAFNLSSDDDLRYFLYGACPAKVKNVEEKMAAKKRQDTKVYQNLLALKELKDKTKMLSSLPSNFRGRTTTTGRFKVDEQSLLSLQRAYQNRLFALQNLKRKTAEHSKEEENIYKLLKWLESYRRYTQIDKLISTYSDFPTDSDNRVRTSFLIHGTATGRLSSRSPNLQNIPAKDKEIRKAFIPEEGNIFISADYNNLEVRVLAYEANDKPLIEAFKKGVNIHDENTKTLFQIEETDPHWKVARAAAKVFMFGGISYGGGDNEIYEKVILKAPELGLTFSQFKAAKQRYMDAHPAYTEWSRRVQSIALQRRRSDNHFGRVRILLGSERDILKESLNNPIQSGAASIINRALINVYKRLKEEKLKSKLLLQIHDELLLEVPLHEKSQIKEILKEEMMWEVDYNGDKVTFPIEIKTGLSWGELK